MLNGKLKKEAIVAYETAYENHKKAIKSVVNNSETLQLNKVHLKKTVDYVWAYLNTMKNKPEELTIKIEGIKIEFKKFKNAMYKETAIPALSGAAAANAALAWLGGGALAGGGMAGRVAFLTLAGSVGWAIGGAALVGAGLFARSKNKKSAEEAFNKARNIRAQTQLLNAATEEIKRTFNLIKETDGKLQNLYEYVFPLTEKYNHDVKRIAANDGELLSILMVLINNTKSAAELINRPIGDQV